MTENLLEMDESRENATSVFFPEDFVDQRVEFFLGIKMDRDSSAFSAPGEVDLCAEMGAQAIFDCRDFW